MSKQPKSESNFEPAADAPRPSSRDLGAGIQEVTRELEAAEARYKDAAYQSAVAREDLVARKRLAEATEAVARLKAELTALQAAKAVAHRREQVDALEARVGVMETEQTNALAAVDATGTAFAAFAQLAEQLGAAYRHLVQSETAAQLGEVECRHHGRAAMHAPNPAVQTRCLVEAVLWRHLGDFDLRRSDLCMDSGGQWVENGEAKILQRQLDHARDEIRTGTAKRIATVRSEADARRRQLNGPTAA